MIQTPIRLGILGARRGRAGIASLHAFSQRLKLMAVCDPDENSWAPWREQFPDAQLCESCEELLDNDEIDAVFIATPLHMHPDQALRALRAGKHVLTEVPACYTLDHCWELVETVESSGLTYMMAENYCYMRPNMMVRHMVDEGLFGELIHAEGAYIHDCRALTHDQKGNVMWRGQMHHEWNTVNYPTHSLGPVSQWLGVNQSGGDDFETLVALTSSPKAMRPYYEELFGKDHPGADPSFWSQGDSQAAIIRTRKGVTINLRVDWTSPRPHNMTHYGLQGTRGAYLSPRYDGEDPLIWLDGSSPGYSPPRDGREAQWESLWNYSEVYEHPLWRRWQGEAGRTGHGGGDFFVLMEFADSILEDRRPAVDVYDAVTWSAVIALAAESIRAGGQPVSFPRFKKEKVKRDA